MYLSSSPITQTHHSVRLLISPTHPNILSLFPLLISSLLRVSHFQQHYVSFSSRYHFPTDPIHHSVLCTILSFYKTFLFLKDGIYSTPCCFCSFCFSHLIYSILTLFWSPFLPLSLFLMIFETILFPSLTITRSCLFFVFFVWEFQFFPSYSFSCLFLIPLFFQYNNPIYISIVK